MIPFSILDLSPIPEGGSAALALAQTLELAQQAERLGFTRFWLAEHHNMPGIASAATAVVIGHVAGGTKTIRVGAGGIMLPNHAPLIIAEQFGTLASLFPERIDLGLGRAPGTDQVTARALRRDLQSSADQFPGDVQELQHYFQHGETGQVIHAIPGEGLDVPIWLLGSSLYSAQLAALLGLPFAFASHFAPGAMLQAANMYREHFKPSSGLDEPYLMLAANVVAAETDEQARREFTSQQQAFINLRRGKPGRLPPPIDDINTYCTPAEKTMVENTLSVSFVGAPDTVQKGLDDLIVSLKPNELMITAHVYNQSARLRSLELVSRIRADMAASSSSHA